MFLFGSGGVPYGIEHDADNSLARLGRSLDRAVAVEVVAHLQVSSIPGNSLFLATLQAWSCKGDIVVLLELIAHEDLDIPHAVIRYRQGDGASVYRGPDSSHRNKLPYFIPSTVNSFPGSAPVKVMCPCGYWPRRSVMLSPPQLPYTDTIICYGL